jgi:MFS family permease
MITNLLNTLAEPVKPVKFKESKYPWLIVVSMSVIMFASVATTSNTMPLFTPVISEALGFSVASIAVFFSIRVLVMTGFQPFAAKLLQIMDVRIVATAAVLLNGISMFAMAFYTEIWHWYISAVINGLGLAVICYIIIPAILSNWFVVRLGTVIGLSSAFSGLGGMILSPIGGQIIASMGYQTSYMILGAFGAVLCLPFTLFVLRTKPSDKNLLPYGAGRTEETKKEIQWGFLFKEALRSPIFYIMLIGGFTPFVAGNFLTQVVNLAVANGFSIENAAMVGTCLNLGILVGKFGLGWIRDQWGVIATYIVGTVLIIAAFLLLANSGINPMITYIGGFVFGMCASMMSVAPPLLARATIGNKDYAPLFAVVMSCGTLVGVFMNPIYGAIFDATGSYVAVTWFVIAAAVIASICAIISVRMSKKKFRDEYQV